MLIVFTYCRFISRLILFFYLLHIPFFYVIYARKSKKNIFFTRYPLETSDTTRHREHNEQ